MEKINWKSETEFEYCGVKFFCPTADYHHLATNADRVILLKDRGCLEAYQKVLENSKINNALEFGIFQGGSPILFSMLFDIRRFVGVDISSPISALDGWLQTNSIGKRIKLHYNVSQDNKDTIRKIVSEDFGSEPVDLIIDDASHQYKLTKKTFEIAFPILKPGGIYVIEDWGWAHWPGFTAWKHAPAMSNLIFELVMSCATSPHLISEVRIFRAFAFITKSTDAPANAEIEVDKLYTARKKKLKRI